MAESALAMKLLNERCLECSIWAMFLSSSFTVSIKARFLMPLRNRFSKRSCPRYPCPHRVFPWCFAGTFPLSVAPYHPHYLVWTWSWEFLPVIDNQMEFEAEEPSHGTFATFGKSFKGLVNQYPLVAAYTQESQYDHMTIIAASLMRLGMLRCLCECSSNMYFSCWIANSLQKSSAVQ